MNKLDKLMTYIIVPKDAYSPYEDRDEWSKFDYLIGYGCPLTITGLLLFGVLKVSGAV